MLEDAELTLAGIPLVQRRPTTLEITGGQLRVTSFDWGNTDDYLTLGGTIDLLGEPSADLTVTAEMDLRTLSAFTTTAVTEGDALLIANVQGPLSAPEITGTMEVIGGGIRVADPPLIVSGLNGAVLFTRERVQFHELVGEANGGPLEVRGELELLGLRPQGELTLVGRSLAMEIPEGLRTEVDADLRLAIGAESLAVDGTVLVARGAYREPLTLAGGVLASLQAQDSVTLTGVEDASALDAVALNIRVATVEDVVVNNNYADAMLGADVRIVGTVGAPALSGRALLAEGGQLRLGNRVYEIETGNIDFLGTTGLIPNLDLSARTRVSGHEITVAIAGQPETLTTSFDSEPPETESDIVSLLLTGRTLDQVGSAPGAAARDQALGLVSGELLGAAGRGLRLDTIRIESEVGGGFTTDSTLVAPEANPGSRLTIGKNLSDEVQLIVSQNLRETGLLTWIIDYLPQRYLELRGVVDDDNDRSYEFRHSLSFAGPERGARAATQPTRRVDQTVVAVLFSGDPGFEETRLSDATTLKANDRFEFDRWQRDRDQLEDLYRDEGFLEARVSARRSLEEPERVSLDYEIVRGPLTVLSIGGYSLSNATVEQMKAAWATAVFDDFLIDELIALSRRELINAEFVDAAVEAEVIARPSENEKEVRIQIEAGPRFSDRRVSFRGNAQLSDTDLADFLEARGLTQSVWTDPQATTRALTTLYQSLGFLEARIEIGETELEGNRALLPIVIDEADAYRIAEVRIQGADGLSAETIQFIVGIAVNDRYSAISIQQARTSVADRYLQDGFTSAHVSIQSTAEPRDHTVVVTIDIDEGARQVVDEIIVDGAGRTKPALVSDALQLEVGQPVDAGAWNQARKRLYDTGAFRRVDIEAETIEPSSAGSAVTQPVRARVILEEWPAFRLRYGLQLKDEQAPFGETGREFNLGVVGDLTHQNFLGRAATVGTSFRYDTIQQAVRGFVGFRSFFGRPLRSNIFTSRVRETIGEGEAGFIDETHRVTLEQRVSVGSAVTVAYSYNVSRATNESIVPDPQFTDAPFWIARLNASAVVDTRDDVFNATGGLFHSSTFEYAPEVLGSDLRFAKYSVQQYYYRAFGPGLVSASGARLGLAGGIGGERLITSERFFAGGGGTVRGYGQDSLGPFSGGNSLLVLNQELRFPLFSVLRGAGFLDAGNVFRTIKDLSITGLEVGAGLGLRANTPFGLLRLDVGFPVNQTEDQGPRFYFAIGQVF